MDTESEPVQIAEIRAKMPTPNFIRIAPTCPDCRVKALWHLASTFASHHGTSPPSDQPGGREAVVIALARQSFISFFLFLSLGPLRLRHGGQDVAKTSAHPASLPDSLQRTGDTRPC